MNQPGAAPSLATTPESTPRLSEFDRITKIFYAPSQTFEDIRHNAKWFVPVILLAIMTLAFSYSIAKRVGWETVVENGTKLMSQTQLDRIQSAPADQQVTIHNRMVAGYKYGSYLSFLVIIVIALIMAALYLATMNFGMGAQLRYGQVVAVVMYSWLVSLVSAVIATIGLYTFIDPQDFQLQAPIASNPAAMIGDPSAHRFLFSFLSSFDLFRIWATVLTGIGLAVLARKSKGTGIAVTLTWMVVLALLFSLPSLMG